VIGVEVSIGVEEEVGVEVEREVYKVRVWSMVPSPALPRVLGVLAAPVGTSDDPCPLPPRPVN
jgi:hypothetical protein